MTSAVVTLVTSDDDNYVAMGNVDLGKWSLCIGFVDIRVTDASLANLEPLKFQSHFRDGCIMLMQTESPGFCAGSGGRCTDGAKEFAY